MTHYAGPVLDGPYEGRRHVELRPRFKVAVLPETIDPYWKDLDVDASTAVRDVEYVWDDELKGWRVQK